MDHEFLDCFACPRCGRAMEPPRRCPACRMDFPAFDGIPWLFAEPHAALAEWQSRVDLALADLRRSQDATARALRESGLAEATRKRLERLRDGQAFQHAALQQLMQPLIAGRIETPIETHLALKTRLPPTQGLTGYAANLFRDWSWGEHENVRSAELVLGAMADRTGPMLVLGAGGARLAYDLHRARATGSTVALDFNPLLLFAARRLFAGDTLTLEEFPLAPRTLDDVVSRRVLSCPAPADAGLRLVLADALRPPFSPGSFDVVVTPWFVDVVDEEFGLLARRINGLLADGGLWVIFGSLAFEHADPRRRYSADEILALLGAARFDVTHHTEHDIPYMNAPGSRHGRSERVVAIAARRTGAVEPPPRHEALPPWLVQGNQPVPLLPAFRMQAMTTRIYAFLMSLIDGRRSLKDMAHAMEEQRLMPRAEAEAAIRTFLTKMWDESQTPPPR